MKIMNKIIAGIVVTSMLTYYASPVLAYVNEETIYSNLDASGKAYQSSVTTIVEDKKGTKTEQNETKESLPIETKITYFLDGKELDSSKIAGQKGRVTIQLEFENKEKHGDLYTPFVVVAGLMINNEKNTNIEIKNGRLLTNGNSSIAIGLALPGMQESLGLEESKVTIPSSVEISMDTEKFELGNIMIYASPKLLSGLDITMEDFDEVFDKVNALETAVKALENGATTLADGMKTFDAGVVALDNGIVSLDNGIDNLKSGVSTLNSGAGQLSEGATGLDSGASQILAGINQAVAGLEPSMAEDAKEAKKTALDEIIGYNAAALGTNVDATIQGLQAQIVLYNENLSEIPSSAELQAGLAAGLLTAEQVTNYETMRLMLSGLIQSLTSNVQLLTLTKGNYQALTQTKASISQSIDDLSNLYNGLLSLQAGMEQVSSGASTLSSKLGDLSVGTSNLQNGVNTLSNGSKQLKDGSLRLTEGSLQLVEGSRTLADGMKQFNDEGISKISSLVENGKDLIRKVEKLEKLSDDYESFASKEKRNDLKFIAITDSIKVDSKASENKTDKKKK